jgi:hypothetical protein
MQQNCPPKVKLDFIVSLAHQLEKTNNRILLRAVLGIPVTLISVPFIVLGFLTVGGLPNSELFSDQFLLHIMIILLSTFGLIGLIGAWARMFETISSLAARPKVRQAIAVSLGLGIVASGGVAVIMLFAIKLWLVALLFVGIATVGWLLLEATCETNT